MTSSQKVDPAVVLVPTCLRYERMGNAAAWPSSNEIWAVSESCLMDEDLNKTCGALGDSQTDENLRKISEQR